MDENKEELKKKEDEEVKETEEKTVETSEEATEVAEDANESTEENKEEKEEENVEVEQEEKAEEKKVEEEKAEVDEKKDETPEEDSEEYYDDINYQKTAEVEKVKAKTRGVLREVLDWVICFILAYALYLVLNYFVFSSPQVKQESMFPTIVNGERVFVLRPLLAGDYDYGDIITFEAPIDNQNYFDDDSVFPVAQYETYTGIRKFLYNVFDYQKVNYVKRVIGLPGDTIEIKDGKVYRNGEELDEDYVREGNLTEPQVDKYSRVTVAEGTLYVMGDNREQSKDSRTFGCIPEERVNGKVMIRVWPLTKFGSIDKK